MDTKRSLKLDEFKRPILTEEQAIDVLLCGGSLKNTNIHNDIVEEFSKNCKKINELNIFSDDVYFSPEQFHLEKSQTWNIPDKYLHMNVREYILSLCNTEIEKCRVEEELLIYGDRDMMPALKVMVFLIDYLRQNKFVWGVGRGSSVASYCLYLIGVHKIDSIYYNLDIKEFLK